MAEAQVPEKAVLASPCGGLAASIVANRQTWTALRTSMGQCFFRSDSPGEWALDPFALLQVIAKLRANTHAFQQVDAAALESAEAWAQKQAREAEGAFDSGLRALCAKAGAQLSGRFPSYILDGYLLVKVSPDAKSCTVGAQTIRSMLVTRVWPEIQRISQAERLRERDFHSFLPACRAAYRRSLSLAGLAPGSPIPVAVLFRELVVTLQGDSFWRDPKRSKFAEYTREAFSRDLAKVVSMGAYTSDDGARMELLPTAFPKEGVLVSLPEGARFIGHVGFREPER